MALTWCRKRADPTNATGSASSPTWSTSRPRRSHRWTSRRCSST